ncbi:MAG: carboxypeptidase-like regulatory domain-containing protein [Bacteroidia bacterium]|nr:carboxypeptidase-like regulatory domain-containing protein [Bacteroidia bacterium]
MVKKYLFFVTIILFCFGAINAQTALTIKGTIKDKTTAETLIGAAVMVKGTNVGTATDFDGNFTLKTSSALPLTLVVSYVGYITIDVVVTDISKPLIIKVEQNVKELQEVEIRDSRITEKQKQSPITVETMDAAAIKQTPAANFYEGLAHLKGVDLTSASIGFKIINTRGFNSTSPVRSLQLIDGVDNQSPGLNFSLGNFLGASELDIQKVDLVVGASSAYYGPNAFNGVINMQSKSPFMFPGLSASVKVGERSLFEGAVRWAQVFKNKKGDDKFAYKFNMFYMRAYDWEATNYEPTSQSPTGKTNSGGYDAVNRYGDENSSNYFYTAPSQPITIGRGYYLREGYAEKELVDYNSNNTKLNASFHYKLTKDIEAIYASSFSTGTTVYQGDNRFSLRDILFLQNRVEVRKENKFFIRAYATNENAGNSFDIYNTAINMQNKAKSDEDWGKDYNNGLSDFNNYLPGWYQRNMDSGANLRSVPTANNERTNYAENYWRTVLIDSLNYFHRIARNRASNQPSSIVQNFARFVPGTNRFDTAYQSTISKSNREGGSRLIDYSALYHISGEYKFSINTFDFITGGNFRYYAPNSEGTIFSDTGSSVITNREVGAYLGIEKKILKDKVKVSITNRLDKNENFKLLWSPAATAVYAIKKHVLRVSVASAVRNPTLSDQYILMDVGRATLKGNLNGFDSLVTTSSFREALDKDRTKLEYFNVAPLAPEQVKTIEFGYRTSLLKDKLYLDMNAYYSWYTDFIGYKIGIDMDWPPGSVGPQTFRDVYRVAANAKDIVTTQGVTIGAQYFYKKQLGFNVNYSWNKLDRQGSTDPLIPAFNTPEHKYNIGISGREFDFKIGEKTSRFWSYGINYKYQTGFTFEGSPQFTGDVEAYGMVDAQISKKIASWHSIVKLGASNLLDNRVYQVYGGPRVGRLAYFSITFELDSWK